MTLATGRPAADPARPPEVRVPGGWTASVIGLGVVVYVVIAVAGAGYLLWKAHAQPPAANQSEFDKVAIGALIAIVGTGLTGLASVYAATRQSATAYQVAMYNAVVTTGLAGMKERSDAALAGMKSDIDVSLARFKSDTDASLARLKVALDAGQLASRELYGTATVYYHALRSAALIGWDDAGIKAAEAAMVTAARHSINVSEDMRNQWFVFWQRAQDVHRAALEVEVTGRPVVVDRLMDEKVIGRRKLRDLHLELERVARAEIAAAQAASASVPAGVVSDGPSPP